MSGPVWAFLGLYCIGWIVSSCLYLSVVVWARQGLSRHFQAFLGLLGVSGLIWNLYGLIWIYQGFPGLVLACVGMSGHVSVCLGLFGLVCMFLGLSGLVWQDVWTCLDLPGLLCTCLCLSGFVWVCSGLSGPSWTFPSLFELVRFLLTGLPRPAWLVWA